MEISGQEYWSGWPLPPLGDLPEPGIKPESLVYPSLAGRFFTNCPTWEALRIYKDLKLLFCSLGEWSFNGGVGQGVGEES